MLMMDKSTGQKRVKHVIVIAALHKSTPRKRHLHEISYLIPEELCNCNCIIIFDKKKPRRVLEKRRVLWLTRSLLILVTA